METPFGVLLASGSHASTGCLLDYGFYGYFCAGKIQHRPLFMRGRFVLFNYLIHNPVFHRFVCGHEEVSVGIFFNALKWLAGVFGKNLIELIFHA